MEETITIQVKSHTRTVRQREVHFTCQLCSGEYTILQHLDRPSLYCATCHRKLETWRWDDRYAAADRMPRLRDARRAARATPPPASPRQTVGH